MALPSDLNFMDLGLILDKEDNLLSLDPSLINIGDDMNMKFNLDKSVNNDDDWTNGVDFLDSLLGITNDNEAFEVLNQNDQVENNSLSTPAESVIESSSCSDSGVSSDQQLSPMVQEEDEEEIEEVIFEEEVYTDPHIKEEIIEIEDDVKPEFDEMQMDEVEVKEEYNPPVVTLNMSQVQPATQPPTMRVKPVSVATPRRIIRVTPLQSNNPRSILIPFNGGSGVRTIKIINAGAKAQGGITARAKQMLNSSAIVTSIDDDKDSSSEASEEHESVYPRLKLSVEEKRLMAKEGITLPSHYPLTKHEERELKRIRRKIRNKISAQDSRKRKKEYVDGLEERVKQCTEENLTLMKRLKALQSQNQSLSVQLRRLHAAVTRGTSQTTQPTTCLMVLVLSVALVLAPNLRHTRSATPSDLEMPDSKTTPLAGRSRTLLFTKPADQTPIENILDQNLSMDQEAVDNKKLMSDLEDLLQFKQPQQDDHDYSQAYTVGRKRTKTYIVPDIDDTWPPPKIQRSDSPKTALHNKTRNPPDERKYIVELPE